MRIIPFLLLALLLGSCDRGERERELAAAAAAARTATLIEVERALSQAIELADRAAGSADRILSPLPVMTPADEEALRRFLSGVHVDRSRALGVRVADEEGTNALLATGQLVALPDSTRYWIVRPGASPAHVVPDVPRLLEELGRRFHERLAEMELPPYRMEVTSALRTTGGQARLRESNTNAAAGVSSHEFGTTVDVSYSAFAPPAERPTDILARVPPELEPHVRRLVDLTFESVSARKSRELGAIFSQVLEDVQSEGMALVIYERQQTVFHLTVGRDLAP